ncbi:hypothetical protein ABZY09_31485 [Streptomyces sp. NPDC002928]|uniref:hypothetical protein n=1 Tax=Streptomyces sp. NPDC002928 TaxID=3154440 RepID=UPI0033A8C773
MAKVLTWVIQRRVVSADRMEQLRKELTEREAEAARLEAAKVVCSTTARTDSAIVVTPLPVTLMPCATA